MIPITLYLGSDKWDAPTSLYEMFDGLDERLKPFIPDYKITLVSPEGLKKDDLNKFETDLKEFFGAIKYSKDKDEFESFIKGDLKFTNLNNETVSAINMFAETKIPINKKGGSTNMCKAIEDMKVATKTETSNKMLVSAVEALMKNLKVTAEEACAALNYTMEGYNSAKKMLNK